MARIPVCLLLSFTLKTLRECHIIPGKDGSRVMRWHSSRTKKETGSVYIWADAGGITVDYTWSANNEPSRPMQERIEWAWLRVGYGTRAYFSCPVCGRRCGRIMFRAGRWVCKKCAGACSDTENDRPHYRLMGRYQKIRRERLGWEPGEDYGFKPKGMHQKTFDRLRQQADELEGKCLGIAGRLWLGEV